MQIYFVILIFLLFSDQFFWGGGQKSLRGANCLREAPPALHVEESQTSKRMRISGHLEFFFDVCAVILRKQYRRLIKLVS